MTQTSGNPDIQAQCNHHDMLKVDYLVQPLAQTMAQNGVLWKDFNDSVRLLFRGQAFPENCEYDSYYDSSSDYIISHQAVL